MRQTSRENGSHDSSGTDREGVTKQTRVAEVMTNEIITLRPHDSFEQAVSLMANHQFRHFVAIDNSGRIAGVISDRDIFRALARGTSWHTKTVAEIMTSDPFTVNPDTPLYEAVAKMISRRINCLPVIDSDGTVCGILTSTDLLRSYQKVLEAR